MAITYKYSMFEPRKSTFLPIIFNRTYAQRDLFGNVDTTKGMTNTYTNQVDC